MFILFSVHSSIARAAESAGDTDSASTTLISLIVPLLTVVFGLAALWWMLRRHAGRGGAAGPARIVQVLGVGPRERVLIVDCDSHRFLLGVTQSTISLLAELGADRGETILQRDDALHMTNKTSTYD